MFKNDHATSVAVKPVAGAASGDQGYFADAPPGSGVPPTVVRHEFLNTLMDELLNVVLAAGLVPAKADDTQLSQAILALIDNVGSGGAAAPLGLTIANTPGHTTTQITIAAGLARDSTNTARIQQVAPIIKKLDAVFAAGGGNGGRDTAGALANGQTWWVFVILNPATGAVDGLFSQSPTAPTLPAGFTKFRRLGGILLEAASTNIRQFVQKGDDFMLTPASTDYANQANGAGAPTARVVSVPNGRKVKAYFHFQSSGTIDNNPYYSGVFDPDDGAPPAWGTSTQRAQIRRISAQTPGAVQYSYETDEFSEWTDASQHVYTFSSDASDTIKLETRGWRDDRSQFL